MNKLHALLEVIEPEIRHLKLEGKPQNLYEPMSYIIALGGKRIRPAMVLASYKLFKPKFSDDVISLAMAVEMFHNFSLIHDDIMDRSDVRRGAQTVHTKWDEPTAILSGDLLLIKVYERLCQLNIPGLMPLFNQMAIALCEGQMMDMDFEHLHTVSNSDYLQMIEKKTAVLLAFSLEAGALLAGAPKAERKSLHLIGIHLGLAFQLMDDYLDSFGEQAQTGKRVGGDIIEQKKTYLWNAMMEALEGYQQMDLQSAKQQLDEEAYIKKVKDTMCSTGADQRTMDLATFHCNQAMSLADRLDVSGEMDYLSEIMNLLAIRQF